MNEKQTKMVQKCLKKATESTGLNRTELTRSGLTTSWVGLDSVDTDTGIAGRTQTGQIGIKGPPKPVVRECRQWHDEGYHQSQSTDGRKGCVMVVVTDDVWPATGRKMT